MKGQTWFMHSDLRYQHLDGFSLFNTLKSQTIYNWLYNKLIKIKQRQRQRQANADRLRTSPFSFFFHLAYNIICWWQFSFYVQLLFSTSGATAWNSLHKTFFFFYQTKKYAKRVLKIHIYKKYTYTYVYIYYL